ncbi:RNA polymerase sigma factor SigX [Tenuibacillus multivorans]|uniref:RNA polymerase sigma factor n=1 Tax=Tenuibacillus multivorans TaxID=237069 RepID=A0A1H0CXK8_9BACI|nr:RNA polymerase sigma factor SigX [Tenuibacillus multivorans]GEL76125.1 ECF RNA polymerase sigma factor SigX [Tenuibacillus multivorans]SDN62642.1 RNA polymerase sigma-70 factor, ECF subfamily [Tenuibacillus multivorans]
MRESFQELYDEFHQDLYQFIFYMVKDKPTTEDLVQEVYIRVLQSYDTFAGKSSQKTWLFSIARHVTIDFFRKQGRRKKRHADGFDFEQHGNLLKDNKPTPEELAEKSEEVQMMYQCLDKCSNDQRMVIILRYIQQMSIKETADILNWSTSKVKTTQHRAINALKDRMLQRKGGHEE